jgi:hypothetical protein
LNGGYGAIFQASPAAGSCLVSYCTRRLVHGHLAAIGSLKAIPANCSFGKFAFKKPIPTPECGRRKSLQGLIAN